MLQWIYTKRNDQLKIKSIEVADYQHLHMYVTNSWFDVLEGQEQNMIKNFVTQF